MNLKEFLELLARLFGHKEKKHKPKPDPTPKPTFYGIPEIVNGELRIDGKRAAGIGIYWMLVDAVKYPTATEIRAEFTRFAQSGVNLVRVWVLMNWDIKHLVPWVFENGKYNLNKFDESFFQRIQLISSIAHELGIVIAWVVFDGYSLRLREKHWACNPMNHVDSNRVKLFAQENYDSANMFCLSRAFWTCASNSDGTAPDPNRHAESFDSPTQWELVRMVAANISEHDILYLWSEMFTDSRHDQWDVLSMAEWQRVALNHIDEIRDTLLVGNSTGALQSANYRGLDIADIHGLTRVWDIPQNRVDLIPSVVTRLRSIGYNNAICTNTDGSMELDRFNASFVSDLCQKCWIAGTFPEFKGGSENEISGILQGIAEARKTFE